MINPLLAIELKVTPVGNPFNEDRNLAFLMLCNATPQVGLLLFTVEINIAQLKNIEQPGYIGV